MYTDAALNSSVPAESPAAAPEAAAPFQVVSPEKWTAPFIFASPHSGRDYPDDLLNATRLDPLTLRRSEDCFVDELFSTAPAYGAPLLKAHFPRAYCDVNRDPGELDPALFLEAPPPSGLTRSPRVHAGLGVIARVVRDGAEIYRRRLPLAEAKRRLDTLHAPYHAALAGLIADARQRFGKAVLIDCHSMPSLAAVNGADIILGDRYGASCSPALTACTIRFLSDLGFRVGRNNPYAGGYTAEAYGAPPNGVHVLQIEINRGIYLEESRLERLESFQAVKARLDQFIAKLTAFQDF